MQYRAPTWLPGGHAQTIWSALYARRRWGSIKTVHRERWTTPDDDFLDIDKQLASRVDRPMLVLFHGLEGSSTSHYAQAFADWATEQDMNFAVPHFRGCSGQLNLAPRAYHSGDHEEINWVLQRLRSEHQASGGQILVVVGISLGGNALMRWAGLQGHQAQFKADAIAALCSPLDLMESGLAIGRGLNRYLYTPMFLRSMKPKALAKWAQHPGLFDKDAMLAAQNLHAFDNAFTAPVHGFKGTDDYWRRASAKPLMRDIRLPALALNALNDPFVPANSLPETNDVSASVTLWQTKQGGHVGYPQGRWPAHVRGLPEAVGAWLLQATGQDNLIRLARHG
jgi:predicted alpha/beta-fold hydrolase